MASPWYFHSHSEGHSHVHERGEEKHHHNRQRGKTYFKVEFDASGDFRVKCEGHWSVDLGITDDWAYPRDVGLSG